MPACTSVAELQRGDKHEKHENKQRVHEELIDVVGMQAGCVGAKTLQFLAPRKVQAFCWIGVISLVPFALFQKDGDAIATGEYERQKTTEAGHDGVAEPPYQGLVAGLLESKLKRNGQAEETQNKCCEHVRKTAN